jgi:hydrogenase maturation factor
MKQTAVEWLIEQLLKKSDIEYINGFNNLVEQAKEIEKEEIMNSWVSGVVSEGNMTAEQYFNETFVSKESDDHIVDINKMVEISDEEIIKLANEYILYNDSKRQWVIEGMKLYKKQLKNK